MPSIDQLREFVRKAREGLVLLDEQRAVIVKGIEDTESLINAMESAGVKA